MCVCTCCVSSMGVAGDHYGISLASMSLPDIARPSQNIQLREKC